MPAPEIEQAKREAELARHRLETTVGALQQRLHPKTLATDAWEGAKEKGSDLTDSAMGVVRERPAAVSAALAAFALFLARRPIGRVVGRMFHGEQEPDGRIVTNVHTDNENYSVAAPRLTETAGEGVR
jgi:hypothetical protein